MIIGKPNTLMIDLLCEKEKLSPDRFLMIGDTFESDIRMADRAGCKSILINKQVVSDVLCSYSIKEVPEIFK